MVSYIKTNDVWTFGAIQPYSDEVVIQLSALGEHHPAWKEFLETHLMPYHVVAVQRDSGLIIRQHVPSQSTPTPSEASCCHLVSSGNMVWNWYCNYVDNNYLHQSVDKLLYLSSTKLKGGYTGIRFSVCLSPCLSTHGHNSRWCIHMCDFSQINVKVGKVLTKFVHSWKSIKWVLGKLTDNFELLGILMIWPAEISDHSQTYLRCTLEHDLNWVHSWDTEPIRWVLDELVNYFVLYSVLPRIFVNHGQSWGEPFNKIKMCSWEM